MSQSADALIASLSSADATTRREAAEAFARLGPDAASAAVPLVKACGDQDEQVRDWAVAALEELETPDSSTTGELQSLVNDESLDVAFWATTLLGRLEHHAAPAVETLAVAVASHPELVVRQRAAWALGKIGAAASAAVPQLEQAASSEDPRLARFATTAIEAIRG